MLSLLLRISSVNVIKSTDSDFLCNGVDHVTCITKDLETNFSDLNFKTNILKKDLIVLAFVIKATKYLCFHIRKSKTMKTLTYCFG